MMKIVQAKDYQDMSSIACQIILEKIKSAPSLTLGLATGSTPKGLYDCLAADYKENRTSYKNIHTVNLDEYIGLPKEDKNSYHTFMNENLFKHIDIPVSQTYIPNGLADDLAEECRRYDRQIKMLGGIDLQVLGIGQNGHIGFNEPGTPFSSRTHVVDLDESTIEANSRFFSSIEEVPNQAITMGIASILDSREILLLASGKSKAEAVYHLLNGIPDEKFPASVLQLHPHVTIVADAEALQKV
jgi:glucosamine-6-phosphate deaminase